jgi:DNA-binding response OmpR family regulator
MQARSPGIVLVDNNLSYIHKSLQLLSDELKNVHAFNNENDAIEFISRNEVDIVLLNLDLSPRDALFFSKDIQTTKPEMPPFIIVYSDKQEDFIQEVVLNSGIDAFINFQNKPAVLLLFIKNLLKRKTPDEKKHATIVVDKEKFLVFMKEKPIQLPRKEFSVFELLYNHPDRFYTKTEIAEEIWKDARIAQKRTIDVHVYNLRKFFGKKVIQSQKGKGYRFNSKFI